jgi:hypothetical protein
LEENEKRLYLIFKTLDFLAPKNGSSKAAFFLREKGFRLAPPILLSE